MRARILLSGLALVACSRASDGPDPAQCDPSVAREDLVRGARRSPDGEGWCCPRALRFAYESTDIGGFVPDPCACASRSLVDAPMCAYESYTDAHGCEGYSFAPWGCSSVADAGAPVDAGSACDACEPAP